SADQDEDSVGRDDLLGTGGSVAQRQGLQGAVSAAVDDLRLVPDVDVQLAVDLVYQVPRHGLGEGVPTDQDGDPASVPGKMPSGPAGGVAAPHHKDGATGEALRLGGGGAVEDAHPGELVEGGDTQPAIADPHREDYRTCRDLGAVRRRQVQTIAV